MEREDSTPSEAILTSEQKLAKAHGIIAHFFEATDLDYMRLDLWNLLKAATGETLYSFAGEPSTVLYVERHLLDMIKACSLLLDVAHENGEDLDIPNFEPFSTQQVQADRQYVREMKVLHDQYSGVIRRLTLAETRRPVLAIKRVFNVYVAEQWKEILQDWVEYGLSKVSICEATGACSEILQYELLESLLEVVYLIARHDERIPYQKRRLQKLAGSKAIIELLIAALEPELIFEIKHPNPVQSDKEPYRNLLIVLPDKNHKFFKELEWVFRRS